MSDMTLGEQLRAARKAANLLQRELAALAGVHREDIVGMESGRRPIGRGMAARLQLALERARQEQK